MAQVEFNRPDLFPAGTRVGVYPRLTDEFRPGGEPVKETTVGDTGDIKVTGLDDNAPYYLAGDVEQPDGSFRLRSMSFTAKSDELRGLSSMDRSAVAAEQTILERAARAKQAKDNPALMTTAPGRTVTPNIVTGARSSKTLRARHGVELNRQLDEREKPQGDEIQPFVNQMDVEGVAQRSDTPFGEVHIKEDVNEQQPAPTQDTVDEDQPQRSDTEMGEATPKNTDEVQPAIRQEDAPDDLKQRSSTPHGSIEPKPKQSDAPESRRKVKNRKGTKAQAHIESADAKAKGETTDQPEAKVSREAQNG